MPTRQKAGRRSFLLQGNSPLLKLPAELRNHAYECVASNTDSIAVREDRTLYAPPLSLVCRQTRHEYEKIYLVSAAKYANKVDIHITNFVNRSASKGNAASWIERLPPPISGTKRTHTFRIWLTNMFDAHQSDLRSFCEGNPLSHVPLRWDESIRDYGVEIRWDPRSFDVDALRRVASRQRWYYLTSRLPLRQKQWMPVEAAIEEAYARFAPASRTGGSKRKKACAKAGRKVDGKRRRLHAVSAD